MNIGRESSNYYRRFYYMFITLPAPSVNKQKKKEKRKGMPFIDAIRF